MSDILIDPALEVDGAAVEAESSRAGNTETATVSQGQCLNCGAGLAESSRYCPMCGQPASTGRLESKDLLINSLGTITRVNKGALHTCFSLLVKPWRVIAGYIHGQRLNYTDPVKLLIGLGFIYLGLKAMLNLEAAETAKESVEEIAVKSQSLMMHFLEFLADSRTLQDLIAFLPVVPVMMLLNRKDKVFRYNFAECFVGAVYMSDAVLIVKLLCLPLLIIGIDINTLATVSYMAIMGPLVVYKSFDHFGHTPFRKARRVARALLLMALSYLLIILLLATLLIAYMLVTHTDSLTTQ